MRGTRPSTARRAGYTLLEMLLVLTVIIVLTSLSWSPLMRLSREQRVKGAADEVRALAAGTRILALDQDVTFQFRVEPGGRRYIRVPYEAPQVGQGGAVSISGSDYGQLPEGMSFQVMQGASGGGGIAPEILAGLPHELGSVGWSGPVLFFADGSATAAKFEVIDELSATRVIAIRDLTGVVTVKVAGE